MLVCVLIQFASPLRNGSQDRCFSFFNGSQDDVLFFFLKVLISIFYVSWLNKCCFSLFLLYYRKELSKTLCDGEIVHLHFKPACIKRKKTLGLKLISVRKYLVGHCEELIYNTLGIENKGKTGLKVFVGWSSYCN